MFKVATKFPRRKSDNISPYFCGGNPIARRLRWVIACQMLFSLSFRRRNRAMGIPHFHGENPTEFCVWCATAHRRVSRLCMRCVLTYSHHDEPKPSKVLEHVDTCHLHMETNVTWWHGSRQSHHDDHAHNIAWICTYDNRLEHIPILQGQELSWLERAAHIAIRVHHTKCTITHTQASKYIYIYIKHASCTMLSHRTRK